MRRDRESPLWVVFFASWANTGKLAFSIYWQHPNVALGCLTQFPGRPCRVYTVPGGGRSDQSSTSPTAQLPRPAAPPPPLHKCIPLETWEPLSANRELSRRHLPSLGPCKNLIHPHHPAHLKYHAHCNRLHGQFLSLLCSTIFLLFLFLRQTRHRSWLAGLPPKQMASQRERCQSPSLTSTPCLQGNLPLVSRRGEHSSCLQGREPLLQRAVHSCSGPKYFRKPSSPFLHFLGHLFVLVASRAYSPKPGEGQHPSFGVIFGEWDTWNLCVLRFSP